MQEGTLSILAAPGKRGALAELFEQVPDPVEKLTTTMKGRKEQPEGG